MKVKVTKENVVITECSCVNEGEVCVNECYFQLPECFEGLSVTAAFNNIPVPVFDNKCNIPSLKKGTATLGVYAYKEHAEGIELMYSPKPTVFLVNAGSYSDEMGVEIVPTISEFEQFCKSYTEEILKNLGTSGEADSQGVSLLVDILKQGVYDTDVSENIQKLADSGVIVRGNGGSSGGCDIEILTTVEPSGEHTNEQVYGALALDEALITFDETLQTMQPELVSGENIKTINGESILGEGELEIIGSEAFEKKAAESSNLLDISTKETGMIHTDGKFYNYENYRCFGYIPVNAGDVLSLQWNYGGVNYWSVTDNGANGFFHRVAAFDANKMVIPSSGAVSSSSGKVISYEVPDGVAFVRITLGSTSDSWDNIAIVKNVTGIIPYESYGAEKVFLRKDALPLNEPLVFLPDEIACAVGRTIEIYNSQVCPLANKYHIKWDCAVGKALKRKFSITGTENLVGEYPLSLSIYDDDLNVLYQKTTLLKITQGISTPLKICPIGDSLTNGKYWLNEVRALSSNNISFVGTRGTTDGLRHEGRSGFTAKSYLKNTAYSFEGESVHPFFDTVNGGFSWEYYKNNTGVNPDAVQIFLGTNDLAGSLSENGFSSNVKLMVDRIRADDANLPIYIVLTICWGNQDGIGVQTSSDGFASQKGKFKYEMDTKIIKGVSALYDKLKGYTNLYFIPLTQCHDSEYNFGSVETPVNPRATQKEFVPVEAIHPQKQGYEQIADIIYSVISLHN